MNIIKKGGKTGTEHWKRQQCENLANLLQIATSSTGVSFPTLFTFVFVPVEPLIKKYENVVWM